MDADEVVGHADHQRMQARFAALELVMARESTSDPAERARLAEIICLTADQFWFPEPPVEEVNGQKVFLLADSDPADRRDPADAYRNARDPKEAEAVRKAVARAIRDGVTRAQRDALWAMYFSGAQSGREAAAKLRQTQQAFVITLRRAHDALLQHLLRPYAS